jgi:hypothetical protein
LFWILIPISGPLLPLIFLDPYVWQYALYILIDEIAMEQMNLLLLSIGLPILSCTVYLTLYTPNIQDVITGTQSNFETSGGFGPNQVLLFLGLGMFVFFSRIILESRSKFMLILNLIIALNISYRGIVTFLEGWLPVFLWSFYCYRFVFKI